jgi:hypothetical protein
MGNTRYPESGSRRKRRRVLYEAPPLWTWKSAMQQRLQIVLPYHIYNLFMSEKRVAAAEHP